MMGNIYIICPVRNADGERINNIRNEADKLRRDGHVVHFPPDDAPQDDPTGAEICRVHRIAMAKADEVHVFWDIDSKGSHFDLGMAYALNKPIVGMCAFQEQPSKSYWNAVIETFGR
jgi:nucleoside 2-deoxyribosyltransferase